MTTKPPNPGSKEALDIGCICPVMDNHHGEGFKHPGIEDNVFWITFDCPVHTHIIEEAKENDLGTH